MRTTPVLVSHLKQIIAFPKMGVLFFLCGEQTFNFGIPRRIEEDETIKEVFIPSEIAASETKTGCM